MDSLSSWMEYFSRERMNELLSLVREYRWYVAGTSVVGVVLYRVLNTPRGLPPGPRGWPVIGAVGEVSDRMHEDGIRLGKKYGDIISFYLYGK